MGCYTCVTRLRAPPRASLTPMWVSLDPLQTPHPAAMFTTVFPGLTALPGGRGGGTGALQVVVYGQAVDTAATETKGTVLIENAEQLESYR
eukprot:219946-Prorocentrum_minimum.AAC.3